MVFKEISAIKKLQNTKNKEKFTNIFINSTAHNIFTPINGLLGIAELIEREVTHVSQAAQYVKLMKNCINHLYYTTQNIIEHSRFRLKQQVNELKEVHICHLIRQVTQIFDKDALKKKITFSLMMDQNSKFLIDQSKVSLIFYNILSNAFKHTEQGQITVEAKIIGIQALIDIQSKIDQALQDQLYDFTMNDQLIEQKYLYVSVMDTGTGLTEVSPDKLFNLFSSFKISEENINQQGLGLGLSISSLICKQLEGKLFVEYSKYTQGYKFAFIIPVIIIQQNLEQSFFDENQFLSNHRSLHMLSQIEIEECYASETEKNNHSQIQQYEFQLSILTHCDDERLATKNLNFKNYLSNRQEADVNITQENHSEGDESLSNNSNTSYLRIEEIQIDASQSQKLSPNYFNQEVSAQQCDFADILIVDDTVFNVEIIKMILKSIFNLSSDSAYNGNQAIEAVQKRQHLMQNNHSSSNISQYKLILMDINMAGLDGVETTKIIRRNFQEFYQNSSSTVNCMIYAHTAIPESQFGNSRKRGFDGFLPKPLNQEVLRDILHNLQLINF
eukprot:403360335